MSYFYKDVRDTNRQGAMIFSYKMSEAFQDRNVEKAIFNIHG